MPLANILCDRLVFAPHRGVGSSNSKKACSKKACGSVRTREEGTDMKSVLILVFLAALSGPWSSAAIARASNPSTAANSTGGSSVEAGGPAAKRGHAKQTARQPQSNLSGLKGTVVSEMRATKAFVKENVVKSGSTDRGLMLLAATGMIILQLRRKHKSLPQRPIAPYA